MLLEGCYRFFYILTRDMVWDMIEQNKGKGHVMKFDTENYNRYMGIKEELIKGGYPEIRGIYKKIGDIELSHLVSSGNKKLPKSTAIFNMGAATNCPSERLGLCQAIYKGKVICYALKAERLYLGVLPYRMRQEAYWKGHSAEEFIIDFVLINSKRKNPYTALRINESGDFWGQECVEKAEKIAKALKHYGVSTHVYTARKDLDYSKVKNLVINGSGFRTKGVVNEFKYINKSSDRPKGYAICAGDCRICTRCLKSDKLTVVVKH